MVGQVAPAKLKTFHCAIYTRKSTDENLDTDFNSLDSQQEYCQSFIKSREGEGWRAFPEVYSDPAFTGGNMNRPALRKMLADASQGKFQIVVCYKYDRLSRNTKDFLHILDIFDQYGIAFVSVTQPIDTTSSVGRLMRSILMDFSQFEREMISERTRDKMNAMARKGKRTGGWPILGYYSDPDTKQLKPDPKETEQALEMFRVYEKTKSLCATAKNLNERGFRMKAWTTRKGFPKGGQKFTKPSVWNLLRNPVYIGKITHRKEVLEGEHEGIIPEDLFLRVNTLLKENGDGRVNKQYRERTYHFLLKGVISCASCKTSMTPSSALPRKGERFYYYKCLSVVKMDKSSCPVRSVSAKAIDGYVIQRLEAISSNESLLERITAEARQRTGVELPLRMEQKNRLVTEQGKLGLEISNLVGVLAQEGAQSPMRKYISEKLNEIDARMVEVTEALDRLGLEISDLEKRRIDSEVIRRCLQNFLQLFAKLNNQERAQLVQLLVEGVVYDKEKSTVQIALRPLPEVWGNMEVLSGLFYDRQRWLPD